MQRRHLADKSHDVMFHTTNIILITMPITVIERSSIEMYEYSHSE